MTNLTNIEDLQALRDKLREAAVAEARVSFKAFVKLMTPYVIPGEWGKELKWGAHIELICRKMQDLVEDKLIGKDGKPKRKLQLFLPPGSMKSVLASNLFPAWCFGRHSTWKVLSVGHSTDFAADKFGRVVRDIINTDAYREIFPDIAIRQDKSAAGAWGLTSGGVYQNAGAGKGIAGHRANLGILDDVLSEQTALSKTEREKINNWYPGGFTTRLLPPDVSYQLLINTRWHLNDLSGFILKLQPDEWEVISIAAIVNETTAKLLNLPAGGSYWPEHWPFDYLMSQKATLPPSQWNALYMQSPVQEDGNILKEKDFNTWDEGEPPPCRAILMAMDTAFSEKTGADYSVILVAGIFNVREELGDGKMYDVPHLILLGVKRGRWGFPKLREIAMDTYDRHKPDYVVIEKRASGQSLIQEFRKADIPVIEYNPDRDKVSRAHTVTGILSQHRVWVPQRSWTAPFMDEVVAFPNGEHDDQVDAFVMGLIFLRDNFHIQLNTDYDWGREEPESKKKRGYWR